MLTLAIDNNKWETITVKKNTSTNKLFILVLTFIISCGGVELSKEELNSPDRLLDKGRQYFFDEEYNNAIHVFKIILKKFPDRTYSVAWAQYEIGMAHYLNGDIDEARKAFEIVLKKYKKPSQPRILSLRLIRKIDQGDEHKRTSYFD